MEWLIMKNKKEREMACPSGKKTYETEDDAQRAVRESWLLRDIHLNYYFCMYCFKYHMTSKLKK